MGPLCAVCRFCWSDGSRTSRLHRDSRVANDKNHEKLLSADLQAVHLRIDTIEQALRALLDVKCTDASGDNRPVAW